ncbi:MAG TPA: uroporphyrinogen decarboxylase [Rhizomicrobium sp.]|jgi:uroporphyrinogen decarboxylase|nr:uroporphyrinogen decarboxylase [Rhizomicrobium sp.]
MVAQAKPLLRALRGEALARPPVWLMRQAGRYLPEYRALRANAKNFIDFCLTPELAVEVTLQPVRRFGMDAAILFADILLVPHALGQNVRFVEGEGPRLEPIRDAAALAKLSDARLTQTLLPVMETIKGVRAALPPDVALIGFAGAPWTVATYMIEGQGGSDYENTRRMAWRKPQLFAALMDRLADATAAYLIAQADSGAEALQLFDSWAGAVPAPLFDSAVIAPTARIVKAVKARHPEIPIIGFPRAAGSHLARYAAQTGVDAVGVDHMTDLAGAADAMPKGVAVQGNLDPVLLLEGGDAMDREIKNILAAMTGRPFVFNLGHGVMQPTPPDHVARLVSLVQGRI